MNPLILVNQIPDDFIGGLWFIVENNYLLFFEGIKFTLIISVSGTVLGLFVAFLLVILKIQKANTSQSSVSSVLITIGKVFSTSYIEFFRGTPMLVQAAIFYYGLASIGIHLHILLAGIIIVTLNTAAYLAEVLRSGINAIPKGQWEASKAIGLSTRQTYQHIIFPQVLKNMAPAIGNELIVNIKDTAVLSVIGVAELFYMGKSVAGTYYRFTESYVTVAIIYLVLVLITTRILNVILRAMHSTSDTMLNSESSLEVHYE